MHKGTTLEYDYTSCTHTQRIACSVPTRKDKIEFRSIRIQTTNAVIYMLLLADAIKPGKYMALIKFNTRIWIIIIMG